jgi:hypothetical protein
MERTHARPRPPRPSIVAGIAAILAVMLAAGLIVWRVSAKSAQKPVNLSSLYWVYYKEDLNRLLPLNPSLVQQTLSGPGTYVLQQSGNGSVPQGAIPSQTFYDYADLQTAISSGSILPGVQAVMDDPENWSQTPLPEQQSPLHYMQQFGQTAQNAGYTAILAPGRTLTQTPGAVCGKTQGQTLTQAYLSCNLASAAANAPIFVIQAAPVETDTTQLTQLVSQAAAQARAANPNVIVLATLSSAPSGNTVDPSVITAAARTMLPYVQGFLLNTSASTDSSMITALNALSSGS